LRFQDIEGFGDRLVTEGFIAFVAGFGLGAPHLEFPGGDKAEVQSGSRSSAQRYLQGVGAAQRLSGFGLPPARFGGVEGPGLVDLPLRVVAREGRRCGREDQDGRESQHSRLYLRRPKLALEEQAENVDLTSWGWFTAAWTI